MGVNVLYRNASSLSKLLHSTRSAVFWTCISRHGCISFARASTNQHPKLWAAPGRAMQNYHRVCPPRLQKFCLGTARPKAWHGSSVAWCVVSLQVLKWAISHEPWKLFSIQAFSCFHESQISALLCKTSAWQGSLQSKACTGPDPGNERVEWQASFFAVIQPSPTSLWPMWEENRRNGVSCFIWSLLLRLP